MNPRDILGAIAVILLTAALLTSHIPTAILGGVLLVTAVGNANRASLRHHARVSGREGRGV